jgi:hypothetical protein
MLTGELRQQQLQRNWAHGGHRGGGGGGPHLPVTVTMISRPSVHWVNVGDFRKKVPTSLGCQL